MALMCSYRIAQPNALAANSSFSSVVVLDSRARGPNITRMVIRRPCGRTFSSGQPKEACEKMDECALGFSDQVLIWVKKAARNKLCVS